MKHLANRSSPLKNWNKRWVTGAKTLPCVTLLKSTYARNCSGIIRFNSYIYNLFKDYEYVELYFDFDKKILKIEFTKERTDTCYKISGYGSNVLVSCSTMFRAINWDFDRNPVTKYPADINDNVLFINLASALI